MKFFNENCRLFSGSSFYIGRLNLLFVISFITFSSLNSKAQNSISYYNRQAFNHILYLQFDNALEYIDEAKTIVPEDIQALYLENYHEFLQCLTGGNAEQYMRYKENSKRRIKFIHDLRNHSDSVLLMQAEIQLQTSILAIFNGERFFASKSFYQFAKNINTICLSAEKPERANLFKGLIFVISSSIPDEYQWIMSIIGLEGNLSTGIKMIEEYSFSCKNKHDEYLESVIILSLTKHLFYRDFQKNYKDISLFPPEFLKNPLYRFVYLLAASRSGHNDEVIEILRKYAVKENKYRFCYFDYLMGEAKLNRLDRDADNPLRQFISCTGNNLYITSAYKKLAWSALINNDTISFNKYRKMVLKSDNLLTEADKQAYQEFGLQEMPNISLVKARLLFDGGYYSEAKSLLLNADVRTGLRNVYQQTEYAYRLARIYHMLGDIEKAVKLYRFTFEKGKDYPMYYAAYSALQLGYIYESKDENVKSSYYYRMVFGFKEIAYTQRFRFEAKEGLKRLNQQ